jgi:glucuronosyltransferase
MKLKNERHCIVIVILVVLLHSGESHRILAVMPFSSTSHKNTLVPLIAALADRGHQLVFITSSKTEELQNTSKVSEIVIDVEYEFSTRMNEKNNSKPFFERIIDQPTRTRWNFLTSFKGVPDSILNSTLKDSRVQDLMTNDHFDLVLISMVTTYIGYPFAWNFKCPFILISPNVAFSYVVSTMGDSEHPEYIPNMLSKLTDKMTLLERIQNTLLLSIFMYMPKYTLIPGYNKIIRHYLPDFPSVLDVEKNVSLLFTNTHPSINYPRASPPGMIEVGALHCRPAKQLKPVNKNRDHKLRPLKCV